MPSDFFDPTPEQQIVVLVDTATLQHLSGHGVLIIPLCK
jgi:hypothetical protein